RAILIPMRAEIISVGTEILLGEITDTNSQYLAARLPAIGIDLYHQSTVGDNLARLSEAIERGLARSDVLIITGGLGPTDDDLTREAIADVLGETMFVDSEAENRLRAFFTARGVSFPERNVKQTMLIPSATAIPNPRGTAPGWWVEKNDKYIVAMPGPPAEMQRMWEHEVEPKLAQLAGAGVLVSRVLKTIGVGESHIDEMIAPLLNSTNPTIGVYAKPDGVHIRLAAKADSQEAAWVLIAPVEEEARRDLDADYGIGITGVAGNDEVEGKPPGTMHIAVAGEIGADSISYTFYQGRQATKRRAVTTALFLLRRSLLARSG